MVIFVIRDFEIDACASRNSDQNVLRASVAKNAERYAFYRLITSAEIAKHDCIITRITSHVLLSAAYARIKNLSRVRQAHRATYRAHGDFDHRPVHTSRFGMHLPSHR